MFLVQVLSLPGRLPFGAHHGKLEADLLTFAFHGTPSVHSVNDYYPFAQEDGGQMAPTAAE
jgi:hypothetical protein